MIWSLLKQELTLRDFFVGPFEKCLIATTWNSLFSFENVGVKFTQQSVDIWLNEMCKNNKTFFRVQTKLVENRQVDKSKLNDFNLKSSKCRSL